ncbi:MAG: hypothetical protein WD490_11220, partial [Opitutales bacterium]
LLEKLISAAEQLKYSLSKRTLLETALISAARTAHFATLDEVWKQVDRLKSGVDASDGEKKKSA